MTFTHKQKTTGETPVVFLLPRAGKRWNALTQTRTETPISRLLAIFETAALPIRLIRAMAYIATVMLHFPLGYNAVYLTGLEPATPDLVNTLLCRTVHYPFVL